MPSLGPLAPPLSDRALLCSRWGHRGEEAGAGRLPQPGVEDRLSRGASRVHPHRADIQSCLVGLSVVLPPQRRRPLPCLHQAPDLESSRELELWHHQDSLVLDPPPPRRFEDAARGGFNRRARPLGGPPSTGAPIDVSAAEDGRDGPRCFIMGPQGLPDVQRGALGSRGRC